MVSSLQHLTRLPVHCRLPGGGRSIKQECDSATHKDANNKQNVYKFCRNFYCLNLPCGKLGLSWLANTQTRHNGCLINADENYTVTQTINERC